MKKNQKHIYIYIYVCMYNMGNITQYFIVTYNGKEYKKNYICVCIRVCVCRLDSLEQILVLRKTEGKRRRRRQWMRWLDSITESMDTNLGKLWGTVEDRGPWHAGVHEVTKSRT